MDTLTELVHLTQELCKFQTTKDQPQELNRCIQFIKKYFSGPDFVVKQFESHGKPSLIVSYRNSNPNHSKILLNGHIDVIEAQPQQFQPRIKGDKLLARGAVDMKGGVAVLMCLMKQFAKQKPDLALMIVADEEIGGMDGTGYLIKKGYKTEFALAAEPSHSKDLDITIAEKGVLWLKIIAHGKAGHGSRPWQGENALEKLLNFYQKVKKIIPLTTPKNRWKPTVNLGQIKGGNSPNRIPDYAEMVIDIRYPNKKDYQRILAAIKKIKGFEIAVLESAPPLDNNNFKLIKQLQQSARKIIGQPVKLVKGHGASDLRYTSERGIPSVIFGPYGENYHGDDEYVSIKSLKRHYLIMADFISRNN